MAGSATIRTNYSLEVIDLTPELSVFRYVESSEWGAFVGNNGFKRRPVPAPVAIEGAIDPANLKLLTSGRVYQTIKAWLFSHDFIERLRVEGWHTTMQDEPYVKSHVRQDVFTAILTGKATLTNLVRPDWGNFYVLDHAGEPLPVGLTLDYMSGRLHDGCYDLEKAAAHLLTRPDITILTTFGQSGFRPEPKPTKTLKGAISAIPYYNSNRSHSQHIICQWSPSAEQYREMIKVVTPEKLGATDEMYRAIFKLDLLGLRAAGAALYDTYYDTYYGSRSDEPEDGEE